jgi:hypothetical protein
MRIHPTLRAAGLAAVALLATAGAAGAVEATETLQRSFTVAATAGERAISIENVFGSVRVRGVDGDQVEIVVTQKLHADDAEAMARARAEVRLDVVEHPGRLELVQDGPFRRDDRRARHRDPGYEVSWDWEVTVPRDAALEVSTVNGGEVRVTDVHGRLDAANVNGDVRLEEVGGETEAATVNGDVEVLFAEALSAPADFATVNGEIDLSFPRGFGAELEFSTLHGEVYTDFEVGEGPTPARVESSGKGHWRIGHDSVVVLGGGGPRLECSTINGDILIRER